MNIIRQVINYYMILQYVGIIFCVREFRKHELSSAVDVHVLMDFQHVVQESSLTCKNRSFIEITTFVTGHRRWKEQ